MPAPLYDVLLVCHVAVAFLGFGSIAIAGFVAASAKATEDPAADARLQRFFREGQNWPELLIFFVPLLGLGLLFGGDRSDAGRAWPWLGLVLWVAAAAAVTLMGRPAERRAQRFLAMARNGDAEARVGFGEACEQMERVAAATSVIFVLAVAVMIVQPH